LMLALHRNGRTADALTAYEQVKQRLADELGIDPGDQLRQLHLAILRGDPELAIDSPPPPPRPGWDDEVAVPRQLPGDLSTFTGRGAELDRLLSVADGASLPAAVVIVAIDGMAGVGKTALAVHAAHRLAGRFPDGQLFIDLHGFTEGVPPVDPADALE
ncbi:MAG TPA: BTAD domain-containing putative transcriptional regulator, partial [Streptosporangiaceae bacterium]